MVSCSKRHGDRGVVELQVGEDGGDFERVGEVRVARGALLRAMLLHGIDIGLVEQRLVGIGVVGLHPFDEFVLTHHRVTALSYAAPPRRLTSQRREIARKRRMTFS
jgi:hypothetical protein